MASSIVLSPSWSVARTECLIAPSLRIAPPVFIAVRIGNLRVLPAVRIRSQKVLCLLGGLVAGLVNERGPA